MSEELEAAPDDDSLISVERSIQAFQGPIPPPDMLAQYEEVLPGAAERIITFAERQQGDRTRVNERMLDLLGADLRVETIGQYSALIIAVASATVAIVTAITNPSWVIVPIGVPALTWTAMWALRGIVRQSEDPGE